MGELDAVPDSAESTAGTSATFDLLGLGKGTPFGYLRFVTTGFAVGGPVLVALAFAHVLVSAVYLPSTVLSSTNIFDLAVGIGGAILGFAAIRALRKPIPHSLEVGDVGLSLALSDRSRRVHRWSDSTSPLGIGCMRHRYGRQIHFVGSEELGAGLPGHLFLVPWEASAAIRESATRFGLEMEPVDVRSSVLGWTALEGLRIHARTPPRGTATI